MRGCIRAFFCSAAFIGSIVGAGFASGREVALYFGDYGIWTPITAAVLFGVFSYVFLRLGAISDNVLETVFGSFKTVAEGFVRIANFAVLTAMIAGAEYVVYRIFGVKGGGLFLAVLSLASTISRRSGILSAISGSLIPVLVVIVIVFLIRADTFITDGDYSIISPLTYTSMNLVTGGYLVSKLGKNLPRRTAVLSGVITTILSGLLLVSVYFIVRGYSECDMPLLDFAADNDLGLLTGLFSVISIFTSMTSSLKVVEGDSALTGALSVAAGLVLSAFRFENIVNYAYPLIGVAGIGMAFLSTITLVKLRLSGQLLDASHPYIHRRCQHTQHHRRSHHQV